MVLALPHSSDSRIESRKTELKQDLNLTRIWAEAVRCHSMTEYDQGCSAIWCKYLIVQCRGHEPELAEVNLVLAGSVRAFEPFDCLSGVVSCTAHCRQY